MLNDCMSWSEHERESTLGPSLYFWWWQLHFWEISRIFLGEKMILCDIYLMAWYYDLTSE